MPSQASINTGSESLDAAPRRGVPRACPVCANGDRVSVFDNRMVPCAGYDFSTPILRCTSCDASFAGLALKPSDLNRYYSTLSKYDTLKARSDISTIDRERTQLATAFLAPFLGSVNSILDVGCSSGVLLHALRELGVTRVCGIDPATDAPATAKALFDVPVIQAQAELYSDYSNFDLVCLMAVLEHLLEPRRLLVEIGKQMRPGSRVLIEVPDAGAFDRPGDIRPIEPFGEFSNEHINFFSINDIRRLGRSAGFEVEHWKTARLAGGGPDLFVLLRRAGAAAELPPPDASSMPSRPNSGESVQIYVARSVLAMEDLERRIATQCRGAVLIYGAGNHTGRLMAQSPSLASSEVLAVFDRNPHLQGATIGGVPILAPDRLRDYPEFPVLISTLNARHEIHAALKAKTSQPLILLYD
jgi:SAM-dependent methyltransferase